MFVDSRAVFSSLIQLGQLGKVRCYTGIRACTVVTLWLRGAELTPKAQATSICVCPWLTSSKAVLLISWSWRFGILKSPFDTWLITVFVLRFKIPQRWPWLSSHSRKEVAFLDFCNLFDQCFVYELFRCRFLSYVESASGNPYYSTDPSDFKAFLVGSNCYRKFLGSSLQLSTATSNNDSAQTKRALASLSSSKRVFLSVVVNGRSAGDIRELFDGHPEFSWSWFCSNTPEMNAFGA